MKRLSEGMAISLRNVDGVTITDNTIGPGAADPAISTPILLQECSKIHKEGNR